MPMSRGATALVIVGIALASINLRTAVTSVGALLPQLQRELGMSGGVAGVLTTLPVLCFALFGSQAAALSRRLGQHRTVAIALAALVAGLVVRVLSANLWVFLPASALALAGCALGNVLMPALVKRHFPDRIGPMTTLYSTGLAAGTTIAAATTVPISAAAGGWQVALGCWAVLAAAALVPWVGLIRHDVKARVAAARIAPRRMLRTRIGLAMPVYFGGQSLQAYIGFGWLTKRYVDAGMPDSRAGTMLAIMTAVQIPVALAVPALAARMRSQRPLVVTMIAIYVLGYAGLFAAPTDLPWAWAALIGIAGGAFPLALTMIGLRASTTAGTTALSGLTQSVGYLIAGGGPLLVGVLHDATGGGWTAPFTLIFAALVPQLIAGWICARPGHIEDEIA